jgi:hypothetical protein
MVIRPLEPPAPASADFLPAWDVVMRLQKQQYETCWMITQPSHAALAGEIASHLDPRFVPQLEPALVRAIALHDAGWGMPDAQAVMRSRSVSHERPKSFLETTVGNFLTAWTQSIDIAESTSPAGGYLVSRHFWRLAKHWAGMPQGSEEDRKRVEAFIAQEDAREAKLTAKQQRSRDELERLTDVLQFCDLLSLYICCGSREKVEFPEYFGVRVRASLESGGYRLDPQVVKSGSKLSVAAMRHPAEKGMSGQEIEAAIL